MTTKITHKLLALAIAATAYMGITNVKAQTTNVPNEINFQAIARDASDNIVQNSNVQVYFDVIDSTSGNAATLLRQLIYQRPTDNFGQFSLTLAESGPGFVGSNGSTPLGQINWASGNKWIRISYQAVINGPTYNLGSVKAGTTFYAFHARTAENITLPATNGQVLKYNGTSNKWEAGADNNTTYTAGSGIAISGSNVVSATDASSSNELQTLTQTGNSVTLSNSGGTINVDPSVTNELPTAGAGISVSGNTVSVKSVSDYAVFEHQETIGTDGGSCVSGWQIRNLNTQVVNVGSAISTLANQTITLQPGTYFIKGYAFAYRCDEHQIALVKAVPVPQLVDYVLYGTSAYSNSTESNAGYSFIDGYLTVTVQTSYILRHYTETARAGDGLGFDTGALGEVYARVVIQKIQ